MILTLALKTKLCDREERGFFTESQYGFFTVSQNFHSTNVQGLWACTF